MAHHPYTEADREIARSIMAAAEDRAAARAETLVEPPPARRLTNRRGAPPPAPGAETGAKPPIGNKAIAGIVGGLVLAVALIALANQFGGAGRRSPAAPPTTAGPAGVSLAPPTEAAAPTERPAQVEAYAAPQGVELGPIDPATPTYRHSDYPGWAGIERRKGEIVWVKADPGQIEGLLDLAEPTPAPTPKIIYVEPPCDPATNPRYVAQLDVALDGRPLGQVTGRSCDSQAAAQADAETQAAQMRASAPTPCPTWAGPPFVKPDCA